MSATIDTKQAHARINALLHNIEDPVAFFDLIGALEVRKIKARIQDTKLDPEGKAWAPWAPFTADKRDYFGTFSQGIMWETGRLLNSIHFDVDGAFGVDIGTDVWYAAAHQDGQGKLPKREIFGWDDQALPQLAATFVAFLERGVI